MADRPVFFTVDDVHYSDFQEPANVLDVDEWETCERSERALVLICFEVDSECTRLEFTVGDLLDAEIVDSGEGPCIKVADKLVYIAKRVSPARVLKPFGLLLVDCCELSVQSWHETPAEQNAAALQLRASHDENDADIYRVHIDRGDIEVACYSNAFFENKDPE